MSFITGKPFVDKVLSGLEGSERARLQALINSSAPSLQGTYRTYLLGSLPGATLESIIANNGYFKYIAFSYDPVSMTYFKGILCRVDNEFSFFSWEPHSKAMAGGVVTQNNYSPRLEQLTTEEFRRVLADLLITGGGDDYKTVNIIEFNNVTLDEHGEATLTVTKAQYNTMKNEEEECVVMINYPSGATVQLHRTKINAAEVTFNKINLINEDEFEVGTATFKKIGSAYSGEYSRVVIDGSGGGSGNTTLYKHVIDYTSIKTEAASAAGATMTVITDGDEPYEWVTSSGPSRAVSSNSTFVLTDGGFEIQGGVGHATILKTYNALLNTPSDTLTGINSDTVTQI